MPSSLPGAFAAAQAKANIRPQYPTSGAPSADLLWSVVPYDGELGEGATSGSMLGQLGWMPAGRYGSSELALAVVP